MHYSLALAYRGLGDLAGADAQMRLRGGGEPRVSDPLMEKYDGLLDSALAYLNRGTAAMQTEEWAEAAALFRKGLELEPENTALGQALGTALSQTGDIDGAVRQFEDVVRWSPEYASAHYSLGVIHASTGRFGETRRPTTGSTEPPRCIRICLRSPVCGKPSRRSWSCGRRFDKRPAESSKSLATATVPWENPASRDAGLDPPRRGR